MRALTAATALAALTAGIGLPSANAAPAPEPGKVTCTGGSLDAAFDPGVTFKRQSQQVQGKGDLSGCKSAAHPKITAGTFKLVGAGTGACPGPFAVGYGKLTITWNDGAVSEITHAALRAEEKTWSFEGPVTRGPGKGSQGHINGGNSTSGAEMGSQCITTGLSNYAGPVEAAAVGGG